MPDTISGKQVTMLRTLASKTFPDDDAYRAWLAETFLLQLWSDKSRPSTLDLSFQDARRAINGLIKMQPLGPHPDKAPPQQGHPAKRKPQQRRQQRAPQKKHPWKGRYHGSGTVDGVKFATQKQVDEIARCENELEWQDSPERLLGFVKKQLGKDALPKGISSLLNREASKVITGLRRLISQPHYAK